MTPRDQALEEEFQKQHIFSTGDRSLFKAGANWQQARGREAMKVAVEGLRGCICNGPMSFEEHSNQCVSAAENALSQLHEMGVEVGE